MLFRSAKLVVEEQVFKQAETEAGDQADNTDTADQATGASTDVQPTDKEVEHKETGAGEKRKKKKKSKRSRQAGQTQSRKAEKSSVPPHEKADSPSSPKRARTETPIPVSPLKVYSPQLIQHRQWELSISSSSHSKRPMMHIQRHADK